MLSLEETPTLAPKTLTARVLDEAAADRILHAAVEIAVDLIREGHDAYWTLLHAGLAAELLVAA